MKNVVIIGAGASGISAAIRIKQNAPECDVTVLEHMDCICKKIHATGNGRCNITNKNAVHFGEVKDFLNSIGLVLREGGDGRMYPYSNQASTVVNIMTNACERAGVNIKCNCIIKSADYSNGSFHIYTKDEEIKSDILILACGGKSQSALGSDGSGYALAKGFCHSMTDLSPALVQLKSTSKHCKSLKGVRTKCNVKIETNGTTVGEEFGELLFTDYGISGIVVMNLSQHVNDTALKKGTDKTVAVIDFVPEMTEEQIFEHINTFGSAQGILPAKLCGIITKQAEDDQKRMAKIIKNWRIIISGTKGYDFAQITKGGIPDKELTERNESVICPNLYIVGEMTDNQFECGGFNLNYAVYSAINAADDISEKVQL